MSNSNISTKMSTEAPSRQLSLVTTPHQNSNCPSTGRRLRSSTRLCATNDNRNENSLVLLSSVKSIKLSDNSIKDVGTDSTVASTTRNVQEKVALFMNSIRTAMKTLIQDHGYSRERAKISLLDQLISLSIQQETNTIGTIMPTNRDAGSSSLTSGASTHSLSLAISDGSIFDYMREKNIGMEYATIALTIDQVLSSMLNDPALSYTCISEILDTWIQCLQDVQPKPLVHLTMKSSSAFGTPLRALHSPIISPIVSQQQLEQTPAIESSTLQQSTNLPYTPVSSIDAKGSNKAMPSHARSKTGGKKSNKAPVATPPLSTITISTTPSTASQQRSRADSVAEAVSAKITSSTSAVDGAGGQLIPIASRGKPPIAPISIAMSSSSGSVSASIVGRSNSGAASLNSNSKRTNMEVTRSEHQQESSLSLNGGARPASPSSLTIPCSNKRQR